MKSFTLCLLSAAQLASAQHMFSSPRQTQAAPDAAQLAVPAPPVPTQSPALNARGYLVAGLGESLCGFINGNASNPLYCYDDEICGLNTVKSAFKCCSPPNSIYAWPNSAYCFDEPKTCYDATALSSNYNKVYATTATYCLYRSAPNCVAFVKSGITGYDCTNTPGLTLSIYDAPGSGSAPAATTSSSSVNGTATTVSGTALKAVATSEGTVVATPSRAAGAVPAKRVLQVFVFRWITKVLN